MLSRRQFMRVAALAGATAAVPPVLGSVLDAARAATGSSPSGYFLQPESWATCRALCARIVPTGSDPATDPGATEASAVVFIDRFLSAFDLPAAVAAGGPAVWLRGRWSGRNPYEGSDGQPSSDYPADDFLDSEGTARFLGMSPAQALSWRYQLYGAAALAGAPPWATAWAGQVGKLIPSPTPPGGLRQAYREGLAAFDAWSRSLFGTTYASAGTQEQDLMLAAAGNLVLDAVAGSLPSPPPSLPAPPAAARDLVPFITLHTFQATYGLPEYSWRNQANDPSVRPLEGTAQWRAIGYDGDTQPLGNSLFDPSMYGPGEGPNQGFGAEPGSGDAQAGVFVPFGGYRQFRPVSSLAAGGGVVLGEAERSVIERAFRGAGGRAG